ncbi:MAG: MBL fold metallo-hydrolase, partial [Lachnospiraceae bacterium]|nr:MBL fold metallo-hydrolase [Lachnospiraceae bacterium]
ETAKHKILMDTGATDLFAKNAKAIGVDLAAVDIAFLSHGHYDHAGGIMTFAALNQKASVWMQKSATGAYYHKSDKEERYIGIAPEIAGLAQVSYAGDEQKIDEELSLFAGITERTLWPAGNLKLKQKVTKEVAEGVSEEAFVQDEFDHEQYLVISEGEKKVLISGCAHNGILNILSRYKELYGAEPDAVFSGFHMRKKEGYTEEDVKTIKEIARELTKWNTKFFTGHCTGEEPYRMMKEIMGEQLVYVHSGDEVEI